MTEQEKTPTAHTRRATPRLGALLLGRLLGLTDAEAERLRADLADAHAELGTVGMAKAFVVTMVSRG